MKSIGIILAAGLGTRLRPSTLNCPKPLIPVAGVEPLFFALFKFYQIGIRLVFVNTHYLGDRISEKLDQWKSHFPGLEIRISHEKKILGTGGALLKIISENSVDFKGAQLILQNGDTLAGIALEGFMEQGHRNLFATSLLPEHLQKYKPLWTDPRGHWSGIGPTAPSHDSTAAHFLGIHSLSPLAVEALQKLLGSGALEIKESDLFNGIYRPLVTEGFIFESHEFFKSSLPHFDFWFDMTSKEFLLEAQKFILSHLSSLQVWRDLIVTRFPGISQLQPGLWSLGKPPSFIEVTAPSLLVLRNPSQVTCAGGKIVLGPHATLIFEGGALNIKIETTSELRIENGVLYVQETPSLKQEQSIRLDHSILGDLYVQ